tara:strand:+ start:133 stop:585 length:453 start_codon:yes stop_codon:yes gene_type:complete
MDFTHKGKNIQHNMSSSRSIFLPPCTERQIQGLSTPNGLAFYNGTAYPNVCMIDCDFPKAANDMIVSGLKMGVSLKQQGIDYKKQMDLLEGTLNRLSNGKQITKEVITKFCEYFEQDESLLMSCWYMDVIALEKLKVIKNDNFNGMSYVK